MQASTPQHGQSRSKAIQGLLPSLARLETQTRRPGLGTKAPTL